MHEGRAHDGLADARVGPGYEDAAEQTSGLPQCGCQHVDESIERRFGQPRIDRHPQARRAGRHAGRPDGAHVEALGLKGARHRDGAVVVADDDRDDLRPTGSRVDAGRARDAREGTPRATSSRSRRSGSSATIVEARVERIGQRRRRRGRKHEGARALDEILDGPATARRRTRRATPSAFPAVLIEMQYVVIDAGRLDQPAAAPAVDADGVRLVHDERPRQRTGRAPRTRRAARRRRPC